MSLEMQLYLIDMIPNLITAICYLIVTVINYFFVYQFKIPLWGYLIIGAFARYLLIGIIADLIYRKKYK